MQNVVFDPYSAEYFNDPYPIYKRMRDEAPVYHNDTYGFYALTRHADVAVALKDWETFSSARGIDLAMVQSDAPVPPQIIMMDPPGHRRMRGLVNRVFTPRAIAGLEPMVKEVIGSYLKQVNPGSFDAVGEFAALFPVDVIATMLGTPPDERQQIRHWIDTMLAREPGQPAFTEAGMQAAGEMWGYFYGLIAQRRQNPQDDMISRLIQVEIQLEDGSTTKLDESEIAGFASLLGSAGAETTAKLVGSAVVLFGQHQDQWRLLRENRDLLPAAVEEVLRHQAPSHYEVRYSTKDSTWHGQTIPAHQPVFVIQAAANRDERVFEDPDRFDITRKSKAFNLGFGYGIHSCLGAALARAEARIAIGALLDLLPEYGVDFAGCERVAMTNVAGWSKVPVRALR